MILHIGSPSPYQNRLKSLLLAFLFLGWISALRAELPRVQGSMPEDYLPGLKTMLANALKQAPQMILSEIGAAQAQATKIGADSQFFPALSGSSSYSIAESSASSNPSSKSKSQGFYYSVGLSQSVFQFWAVKNQSEIAKIGALIAEKNHAEAYRLLANNLRLQYLGLIVKKSSLIGANFRLKISETLLAVEEQKLQNGTISAGEIIGPRLTLEEARVALERVEQDYASSRRLFAHLAGFADLDDAAIPDAIIKPSFSAATASSLVALLRRDNAGNTTSAQVGAFYVRQAELSYKIAKVRQFPKFSAGANISLSNSASVVSGVVSQDAVNSKSVGITGSWSIFDGFATSAAKKSALASKRYYELSLQTQVQLTIDTAENLRKTLEISARALDLTETRTQLVEAGMNRVKDEAKLGNTSQSAVDETTSAYYTYQTILASARAEFFSRWSEFVSLVGADPLMTNLPAHHVR